jgi:predicted transcriptional regulator
MKIAISVPDVVFEAGESLARQLGLSRSQLYADALSAYLSERGAAAVTAKLNSVHAGKAVTLEPAFAASQLKRLTNEAW